MKLLSQLAPRILVILSLTVAFAQSHAESKANRVDSSQAELDQMLAPIALYPDTILSQLLIASTYPIEVVQADRWAQTHPDLKGADAVTQVENKDWDASVKSMVAFPDILSRMSDDIDWTQKIGDAFLADENEVMDTIQRLRKKAYSSGTLGKVEHLRVQRSADEIIIEPSEERVVYVPVYDTRVVYGNWWWADHPPVYWHYPSSYNFVSGFYWGPSIYVGPTFYYSSCHWRERRVMVVDRYDVSRPHPSFYTSFSIIHYEGARRWSHDPVHRRGVAYYNNQLRDDYGSRHQSWEESHERRDNHVQRQTRFDDEHRGNSRVPKETGVNFGLPANANLNPSLHTVQSQERNDGEQNENRNVLIHNQREINNQREMNNQREINNRDDNNSRTTHVDGSFTHYNDEQERRNRNDRIIRYNDNQPTDLRFNRGQNAIQQPLPPENPTNPYSSRNTNRESPSLGVSRPNMSNQERDNSPAYSHTPQEAAPQESRQPERARMPIENLLPISERAPERIIRHEESNREAPRAESSNNNSDDDNARGRRIMH